MNIYCLQGFKDAFDKLIRKNAYKSLEQEIKSYFFNKTIDELSSGVNLNRNLLNPYIKKRLQGKGKFRVYFLLKIKEDNLYLMFVHSKTGTYGAPNITDEYKTSLHKDVLECIKSDNLYELKLDEKSKKISFKKW